MLMNLRWAGNGVSDFLFFFWLGVRYTITIGRIHPQRYKSAGFFYILQKPRKASKHVGKLNITIF
jgi:hypothetical protein